MIEEYEESWVHRILSTRKDSSGLNYHAFSSPAKWVEIDSNSIGYSRKV